MRAVLIETDGYSILTSEFTSKDDAAKAMNARYNDLILKIMMNLQ